jgi:hypothetical protein
VNDHAIPVPITAEPTGFPGFSFAKPGSTPWIVRNPRLYSVEVLRPEGTGAVAPPEQMTGALSRTVTPDRQAKDQE